MVQQTEIPVYRRLFDSKYEELNILLEGLPAEALAWKPFTTSPWRGPSSSIGWLVAHSMTATIFLLRRAEWQVDRRAWESVRSDESAEEYQPDSQDTDYLVARLARTQQLVHEILDGFTPQELNGSRPNPDAPDRPFTVRWNIQHAIEHMSQHIGHAHLTRQLWELANA